MDRESATSGPASPAITKITVRQLFGTFDYDLELPTAPPAEHADIAILYGENGTGKTTLLKLVYHMLAPEPNVGHRTYVRSVPFAKFTVEFGPDTHVSARRKDAEVGEFTGSIVRKGREIGKYVFAETRHASVISNYDLRHDRANVIHLAETSIVSDPKHQQYCDALGKLGVTLTYLSDDRRVGDEDPPDWRARFRRSERATYHGVLVADEENEGPLPPILNAVKRAEASIQRQNLGAVDRGSLNANQIYEQVVEGLVGLGEESAAPSQASFEELRKQLKQLSERNEQFARFGLTAGLQTGGIEKALARAREAQAGAIQRVLKPYLDGIGARLDALAPIQRLLATLVDHVNRTFFRPGSKVLSYDRKGGFQVFGANQKPLKFTQLSSGERQLLLLLCTIVASHDRPTIFLIDEPEISLNVKWQRALVGAMLDCLRGTDSQLIFASHSLELVSRYRTSVVWLDGEDDGARA